ncbi:MAG: hypothetical protein AB7G36_17020, partial [Candidatus Nanopelagicales bacterium]
MPSTPTAPQVCDLSGASLGEVASFLAAAAARLGALIEQGEHHGLEAASQLGLIGELNHAAGLAEAAQAVIASTSHSTGDLRRAGFFSVRGLYADGIGVSAAQGSRISRLGTGMDRYPLVRAGVLAGRICPDSARAACEGLNSATADLRGAARDEARAAGER